MKKERNPFLDILKGALIIIVVIGHVIQVNYPNTFDQVVFFRLIYSFHMPLFIFISGYIAYLSEKEESITSKSWKKFIQLMVPFFAWYFLYKFIGLELFRTFTLVQYTKTLILSPDNGYWFLYVLFVCYIVLYILKFIQKKLNFLSARVELVMFLGTAMFVNMLYFLRYPNFFGIELIKWYLPSFLAGYLIAKHKSIFKKYFEFLQKVSIILFPFFFYFWSRDMEPAFGRILQKYIGNHVYFIENLYKYLTALFAGIIFISIIRRIENQRVKNILNYLGKRTFEIYTLQFMLFGIFGYFQLAHLPIDMPQILLILASTVIIIAFSVLASKYLFEQNKYLTLLFFGRTKRID